MRIVDLNHPGFLAHPELKPSALIKRRKLTQMVRKTHTAELGSLSEKAYKLLPALVPGPLQGRSVYNELRNTGAGKCGIRCAA